MEELNTELIFVSEAALKSKLFFCQNIKMSEGTAQPYSPGSLSWS